MASYMMALDAGTTSNRCILFDQQGRMRSVAQREFPQYYPSPGWVEHNANEIWETQLAVAREAMAQAGIGPGEIAAIGITNQRETTIVWDRRTGEPIAPAIVWQCRRTAAYCDALKVAGLTDTVRAKTGLLLDAYFSGTKLRWILENIPGARARAERGDLLFGTVDTWLIWKLTGGRVHVTDYSNASRTMLFNIHSLQWDDDLLRELNIPRCMLPEVRPSSELYGTTDAALFGAPIPIAGAAGDQQSALFGQTCFSSGEAKNTYGTGCFLLMNTGETPILSQHGLVTTIAWGIDGRVQYALEGSVFIAGAAIQWLRDEMQLIRYARGCIVGLTRGVNRDHIVRATLESLAYQTGDVLHAMQEDSGIRLAALRADGGASANDFLMQFQADVIGAPVLRPACTETTALGAAYLAGLAVGFWSDTDALRRHIETPRVFEPMMGDAERSERIMGWEKAVRCAFGWAHA